MKLKFFGYLLIIISITSMLFTGCLTTQYKEYRFKVKKDGSGEGTIKFVNLISQKDDGKDVSFKDYGELVTDYLEGNRFESDNPYFTVTDKKLYEEEGMLVGEVAFKFSSIDSIGFFRDKDCDCSPFIYYLGTMSETFIETNGTYLGGGTKDFPAISWTKKSNEFYFRTAVQQELDETVSLLPLYKTWKDTKK
ncbi:MAG: hypothetical protein HXY49_02710 [Ignavibacteriaceae bacterium]|nr:hypothetical protein [Ignavibacteriaceae bacterium]